MIGKLYGIGVGPGDTQLITLKAIETINKLDVIYTPQAELTTPSLAMKIAQSYIPEGMRVEVCHFPMVKHIADKEPQWDSIAQQIGHEMDQGHQVGFLTLGDPSTFSTYSYIMMRLKDNYPIETIAGITSFAQIAARLNHPLVLDTESFCVIPATTTNDMIKMALDHFEGVVIMKIKNHLDRVLPLLKDRDLLEKAIIVSNVSMNNEIIYDQLTSETSLEKLSYFSTLIVTSSLTKTIK